MPGAWERALTDWLPDDFAHHIRQDEEGRFRSLVTAVKLVAASIPDKDFVFTNPQVVQESVQWINHIDVFVKTKTKYDAALVAELYHAMMHIVFQCQYDALTQARWLNCAHSVLRSYRKDLAALGVVVDWRPYWDEFARQTEGLREYRFDGHIKMTAYSYLHLHCKMARRLFGSDAATEIWDRVTPALEQALSSESLDAMVYLVTFFPHHAVASAPQLPWNTWAQQAMRLWDLMQHNRYWDSMWMCFLSRLAKHDTHGAIDWEVVVKQISTRSMWFFSVPVGSSTGSMAQYITPSAPLNSVAHQCLNRASSIQSHLAKILIYTLRQPLTETARTSDGLTSLASLKALTRLLEHYYHASNVGSWSKELSSFLDSLSWHLIRRRLPAEARPTWKGSDHVKLDPRQLGPVVQLMTDLAMPCMYHKNSSLQFASVEVITNVVYLEPAAILPMVWRRFLESLEASDSVHQLQIAFRVLAGCVRPMLLHGLEATAEEKELMDAEDLATYEPRSWACKELGRAMMLLLPALDANDRNKTMAAIGFYLSVVSNCVAIRGRDCPRQPGECALELGLYLEDFMLEFLSKIFGVIEALDSAGQNIDLAAVNEKGRHLIDPSWLGDYYKFTALIQQLFVKVPRHILHLAVRKIAAFSRGLLVPQQGADMYQIVAACAAEAPDLTVELLLKPLISDILEDCKAMDGKNPSPAAVSSMLTRMNVLHGLVPGLCHGEMVEHAESLLAMAEAASHVTAPGVAEMTSLILERVLMNLGCVYVLTGDYCKDGHGTEPLGVAGSINDAVAVWCPKDGYGTRKVVWHIPTEQEVQLARRLAEGIVERCRVEVDALIANGAIADSNRGPRLKLRRLQCMLAAVMMGLEDVLPPLDVDHSRIPETPSSLAPNTVSVCGVLNPGWHGCTLAADIARIDLTIAQHTDASNTWSLKAVVVDLSRMNGVARCNASSQHLGTSIRTRDRSYTEPQIGTLLLGQGVSTCTRQPHWAMEFRMEQHYMARIALIPHSWWATSTRAKLSIADMHPLLLKAIASLQQLSLHRYRVVATAAGRALCENYLVWSSDIVAATFPGYIAALALLQEDPACGLPPEQVTLEGGYALPRTSAEIDAVMSAQHAVLVTLLERDAGDTDGAEAMDVDGGKEEGAAGAVEARGGPKNGTCVDENKHILIGVYNVLDSTPHLQTRLTTADPRCLAAMFMSLLVMQRYTLQEVKASTNKTIATIGMRLHRSVAILTNKEVPPMHNLARLLVAKIQSKRLHWRALAMSHVLFMFLAPITHDEDLLSAVTSFQLQHFMMEDIPIIKDTACIGLLQTMKAAFEPGISPAFSDTVCKIVRAAFANDAWAARLLRSLTAAHAMSSQERIRATIMTDVSPEQAIVAFMRSAVSLNSNREGRLHINPTPQVPQSDGSNDPASGPQVHLMQLVEAFGRIAPLKLVATAHAQLKAWNELPPEKEALEPNMEYAAMELCAGTVCCGAAFHPLPGADAASSAWSAWMRELIEARHGSATLQKAPLWAKTIAQALRMLSNAGSPCIPAIAAQFQTRDPERLCLLLVDFVCEQVSFKVTGSSTGDVKFAGLLSYCIDMLIQAQAAAPRPVISTALERLLVAGELLIRKSAAHPLHVVRMGAAGIVPMLLGTMRSPVPLVGAPHRDESDPNSVASRVLSGMRASIKAAHDALVDSSAACEAGAADDKMDIDSPSTPGNGLLAGPANGDQLVSWEASIGYVLALNMCLASSPLLAPLMRDLLQECMPWLVEVQALKHPKLQTLALRIRSTLVTAKYTIISPESVPGLLKMLADKCEAPAWQARAAALSVLQSFWFRNYFAMTDEERMDVAALLLRRLADEKLEIRQLASTTLSGLLQCLEERYAVSVRSRIMAEASTLFPAGRRQNSAAKPSKDALIQSHACVLGLRAVLLSSPYEIAPWMSDVLMAIVRASRLPAPVKTSCTNSLGEFRKTHETTESRPLKERLDPDVWTSICDVAMQSSYFV